MTRVDELQRKYPSIPREIIVKMEALTCGVRDSEALDQVGRWHRTGGGTYQTYDHDLSLQEIAEKRPATASKSGYVKNLGAFYTKSGFGTRIQRNSLSPYEIREVDSGKYGLFEGDEKIEDVYFPSMPWPYPEREEPLTRTGKPITTVVPLRGPNCFNIAPLRHCEYFATGEQCKFCNYNSTQQDARSVGAIRHATAGLEEMVEAYGILSSEVILFEGNFVGGAITDIEREAQISLNFVEKLASAASHKPEFCLVGQPPTNRKQFQRLKDAGANVFTIDIEVWDPRLFVEICPGKARCVGYERYLEAFLEAVDAFGFGSVRATLVAGATLMGANGHKTWQESRDVLIDGFQWMTKNGVVPLPIQQRWAPGSEFAKDPANRAKMPPTEHHLDCIVAHHAAMKEHGLYERMNRFMACPMNCTNLFYQAGLGVLELAGNAGDWLADLIPDELNWLARFVESVKRTPARAQ